MKYLRWYHSYIEREHPHKGSGQETVLLRPGSEVWDIKEVVPDSPYVWVVIEGRLPAIPVRRDELTNVWPPREDE